MSFKKMSVVLILLTVVTVAATSRFADTVQLFDQVALMFGGADRTETGDFYISYDETTDNRLEITDGTNLLGHVTDAGTTANYSTNGGDLTVDDITADDLTIDDLAMDSLTLTTPLPVASGGTGAAALDDILGTANQITVTAGADTIIGGNATLSLPSALTAPGSLTVSTTMAVTGNTTLTGDIAVNGGDVTSTNSDIEISSATSGVLQLSFNVAKYLYTGSDSYIRSVGDGYRGIVQVQGYRATNPRSEIWLTSANGTVTSPTNVSASNGPQGRIRNQYYGDGAHRDAAYIDFYTDAGTISSTSMPGEIRFLTSANGSIVPTLGLTLNSDQTLEGTASWTTSGDIAANGDDFTSDGNMTVSANSGTGTVTIDDDLIVADDMTINGDTLDVGTASALAITGADVTVSGFVTASTLTSNDGLLATNQLNKYVNLGNNAEDDLIIVNDNDVIVDLDNDDDTGTAYFDIQDGDETSLFTVSEGNTNGGTTAVYGRFYSDISNTTGGTGAAIPSATTIASGNVTASIPVTIIVLDDEAPGPGDTLDTVTMTDVAVGDIIMLMTDGDDIIVTDTVAGGSNTMYLNGAFTLTSTQDVLVLMRVATYWVEISRADNHL